MATERRRPGLAHPRKRRCTVESTTDHGGRVYTVDLRKLTDADGEVRETRHNP